MSVNNRVKLVGGPFDGRQLDWHQTHLPEEINQAEAGERKRHVYRFRRRDFGGLAEVGADTVPVFEYVWAGSVPV